MIVFVMYELAYNVICLYLCINHASQLVTRV